MSTGRIGRTLWVRLRIRGHVFGLNVRPFMARHWTPEEVAHD